jgi:hypothetical protein
MATFRPRGFPREMGLLDAANLPALLQVSTELPVETIWPHDENAKRAFSMYNRYADSLDTL